jgi:putative transcriptional regulator
MKNRVKELRDEKGWSQEELAVRVSSSQQQISRVEQGTTKLSEKWIRLLTKAFECKIEDLFAAPLTKNDIKVAVIENIEFREWVRQRLNTLGKKEEDLSNYIGSSEGINYNLGSSNSLEAAQFLLIVDFLECSIEDIFKHFSGKSFYIYEFLRRKRDTKIDIPLLYKVVEKVIEGVENTNKSYTEILNFIESVYDLTKKEK